MVRVATQPARPAVRKGNGGTRGNHANSKKTVKQEIGAPRTPSR